MPLSTIIIVLLVLLVLFLSWRLMSQAPPDAGWPGRVVASLRTMASLRTIRTMASLRRRPATGAPPPTTAPFQAAHAALSTPSVGGPVFDVLVERVRTVTFFRPTIGRQGYAEPEVDQFLDGVVASLLAGIAMDPAQIETAVFSTSLPGAPGYDAKLVDDFLSEITNAMVALKRRS